MSELSGASGRYGHEIGCRCTRCICRDWRRCLSCDDLTPPGDLEEVGRCKGWCVTCSAAEAFTVNARLRGDS
jgi:hypothetical protein